jgi:hypothetical protein
MGYIPPVRDEQVFQYGNRFIHSYRGIAPTSPVIRGKFHETLSEHQRQTLYRSQQQEIKQVMKHKIEKEMTGKGRYIDEVV